MFIVPFLLTLSHSFPYHQPIIDTPFVYYHIQTFKVNGLLPYWLHSLLTLHNHSLILSIGMHLLSQSYCHHWPFSLLSPLFGYQSAIHTVYMSIYSVIQQPASFLYLSSTNHNCCMLYSPIQPSILSLFALCLSFFYFPYASFGPIIHDVFL